MLTASGKEIFSQVDHIEEEFLSIERKILGRDIRYEGKIKLSTTDTLGHYWLPPYIRKFRGMWPGILLDIDIRTGYTDLARREADIVIAAVNRHPDYMVGKVLAATALRLYAARDYIQAHGRPDSPGQLAEHRLLILNDRLGRLGFNEWLKSLVPKSALAMECSMLTTLYHYTRQGLGIAALPTYVGDCDRELVPILDVPEQFHHRIWILTHPDLKSTSRIKAFMQFMYRETSPGR